MTRPADEAILGGITRRVILDLARGLGLECAERVFTLEQAHAAREAFVTGTTTDLLPVTKIDEVVIGDGKPGPISRRLREHYMAYLAEPGETA
jgi:D-alanine transaminase